ncbi:DUF2913 domain-containing protein [Yersinia enterocolitica]|nr:DUF2913 domain-containing protein [Yersinia enterocolitica]
MVTRGTILFAGCLNNRQRNFGQLHVTNATKPGKALSDLERHLFIMQWLHFAQKRHLFSKTIVSDITWLLAQGKKYGFSANLHRKIEFIYRSSMGDLAAQSLLFRFTYFIETLKTMGWQNFLLSQREWSAHWHASSAANAIYTPKAELRSSFNDNGVLIKPLTIRATGDIAGIIALIEQCHLTIEQHPDELDFYVFLLTS